LARRVDAAAARREAAAAALLRAFRGEVESGSPRKTQRYN
jgi:hypothetical protein